MSKPTKWYVRPAKTQLGLGIRPVWSEPSLSAWRKPGFLATHWTHSEDSDQTGRMPRLIWVIAGRKYHFVGFVMGRLNYEQISHAKKFKTPITVSLRSTIPASDIYDMIWYFINAISHMAHEHIYNWQHTMICRLATINSENTINSSQNLWKRCFFRFLTNLGWIEASSEILFLYKQIYELVWRITWECHKKKYHKILT